jgi:acetyltransferase-like isoleucine patch superfamily enzyme
VRIDAWVKIEAGEGVYIGDDTHNASFSHINIGGGTLHIGDRCGIASGVKIVTGGNDVDAQSMTATAPATSRRYINEVRLFDDVSVLANAVVLPGSWLSTGSRLAAGAVLTGKRVGMNEIWSGVPARLLRAKRLRGQP